MKGKINLPKDKLEEFCRRHGIGKLSLFGSVLRDDFTKESVVDMMVEFLPGRVPGYLALSGMELELTRLIGRKVDLRTPKELSRHFRERVVGEAEVQYVHR